MDDAIITSERASDNSSPLNVPSRIICHVCQKQFSKYTCPRCNSRYCGLECYKSHSVRCTESFMRENVVEELRQLQPDDEAKQKMMNLLKHFPSEDETDSMEEDDDDSTLSEETIQKVLSGGKISYDDLSAKERKQFQRAVASGELSKMIEPWDPWWLKPAARTICLSKEGTPLVQPVADKEASVSLEDKAESSESNEIPHGPETPLPPIRKLSTTEPSPLLAFHLVDITYSYCFTLRFYNGDCQSDAMGSGMVVLSISSVLGQGKQPETVLEALSHCLEQTCSPAYRHTGGLQFGLALVDDVVSLLCLGGSALICMLYDLQRLIQAGEREFKSRKVGRKEIKSKLKQAERKIYFMMCWVNEQPGETWSSLVAIVKAEKNSAMDYAGGTKTKSFAKMMKKTENKGKVLIQEMK